MRQAIFERREKIVRDLSYIVVRQIQNLKKKNYLVKSSRTSVSTLNRGIRLAENWRETVLR